MKEDLKQQNSLFNPHPLFIKFNVYRLLLQSLYLKI